MALPKLQQLTVSPRVVKPRDYTLAGNTINALTERHDAALAQRSAIANDLAKNYVLHESEDEFKTNFTNEMLGRIDEKIDANSGYAGNALSETIKVAGEYAIDPRLIGRVRANNDYKAFIEGLNKANISDRQRQYLIQKNPYYYADKFAGETDKEALNNRSIERKEGILRYDDVVGGTKWNPKINAVAEIDLNRFMTEVLATVGKQYGAKSTTPYYKDANGNYTIDFSKSTDGLMYFAKIGGGYEKLDKDKIALAIRNAFDANSNANEWLERQWELDLWDKAKGKDLTNEATNNIGIPLNFDVYKEKIIQDFAKTRSYYKPGDTDYREGKGAELLIATAKTSASRNRDNTGRNPYLGVNDRIPSGMVKVAVETTMNKINKQLSLTNYIKDQVKALGINTTDNDSIDDLYDKIKDADKLTPEIINSYKQYKTYSKELEQEYNGDKDRKDALEFKAAIEGNVNMSEMKNNKYVAQYLKQVSEVFTNDDKPLDKIYFRVDDAKKAIAECGVNAESLGITSYEDNAGRQYISLNKEHAQYLYLVNKVAQNHIAKEYTDPMLFGRGSTYKPVSNFGSLYMNERGAMVEQRNKNWTNSWVNDIEDAYVAATKYLEYNKEALNEEKSVNAPLYTESYDSFMTKYAIESGATAEDLKRAEKQTWKELSTVAAAGVDMQMGDNISNEHWTVPVDKRAEIMNLVQALYSNSASKDRVHMNIDPYGTGVEIIVTQNLSPNNKHIRPEYEIGDDTTGKKTITSDDQFRIYIPNWIPNTIEREYRKQDGFIERQEIYKNSLAGHSTHIVNDAKIDRMNIPNQSPVFTITDKIGNARIISESQAVKYKQLSDLVDQANTIYLSNTFKSNEQLTEFVNNTVDKAADIYASIYKLDIRDIDNWDADNKTEFNNFLNVIDSNLR